MNSIKLIPPLEIIPTYYGYTIIDNIGTIVEVDESGDTEVETSDECVFEVYDN